MDNASVVDRYRQQAKARLEMDGLLISGGPAVQFNDRGNRHVTRANLGMMQRTVCRIGQSVQRRRAGRRGQEHPSFTPSNHIVR